MHDIPIGDRAAKAAGEAAATVGAMAGEALAQVEGAASQATAAAEQAYGQARDQVRGAAVTVAHSVERQPVLALLVVGLICGTLGFLLGRR